jgi:hypothetical protein
VHLHRSVVHLHQCPDQRQSDAQPIARTLQRRIDLREHFKEAGLIVRGNADAGVAYADHRLVAFAAHVESADAHGTLRGE